MKALQNFIKSIKSKPKGFLALLGGFLIHSSLGSIYTYGNMAPYIIRYMNNYTYFNEEVNAGNAMWIFGLSVFGLGASMCFGGFIDAKIGPMYTTLIGGWMMSFGVLITFFTIKVHLVFISLSYGLLTGIGTGIAYGVALAVPSEWFPDSKGLVSGIIVGGFGLGPLVFDFIQLAIINNDITNVQLTDVSKVPISFIIMGSLYAIIQLIGSLLLKRPEKETSAFDDINLDAATSETGTESPFSDIMDTKDNPNITPFELIYEFDFWILWITFALNSVVLVLILSLHKVFGVELKFSDIRLVIVSAISAFFNGSGRIFWGYLNDKIGYRELMSILTLSISVIFGTYYLGVKIGDLNVKDDNLRYVFFFIWTVLLHFFLSGNFSLFPSICIKTFGLKYFAKNYGLLFTAYSCGGLITSTVTTSLFLNQKQTDHFRFLTPFLIGAGLSLLSGLVNLAYRGRSLFYKRQATFTI